MRLLSGREAPEARGPCPSHPQTAGRGILRPGDTCLRLADAHRAAFLVDGDAYFRAARMALARAERSVVLLAWAFAEATRLPRAPGEPDDAPEVLGDYLRWLVDRKPELVVRILVWDNSELLALRRHEIPGLQARHLRGERLHYVLDDRHPPLACHHQKVLVIDDRLAFCGGFDFVTNRWDFRAHRPGEPRRLLPTGKPYEPHHDVMMVVDGPAAAALGDLARERWALCTGEELGPVQAGGDPWPDISPDFEHVRVGIARTVPGWRGADEIREVEHLFVAMVEAARDCLYVENQYLACPRIVGALCRRLGESVGPEIVLVHPRRSASRIEELAMDSARDAAIHRLRNSDRHGRLRVLTALTDGREILIHSKVMIVDDRMLRVGSANLNNRSMGVDTECDLVIEVLPGDHNEPGARATIRRVRADLLAEHLGASSQAVARLVEDTGSVIAAIERLSGRAERSLVRFPGVRPSKSFEAAHDGLADPLRPPFGSLSGLRIFAALAPLGVGLALAFWPASRRRRLRNRRADDKA